MSTENISIKDGFVTVAEILTISSLKLESNNIDTVYLNISYTTFVYLTLHHVAFSSLHTRTFAAVFSAGVLKVSIY